MSLSEIKYVRKNEQCQNLDLRLKLLLKNAFEDEFLRNQICQKELTVKQYRFKFENTFKNTFEYEFVRNQLCQNE